jgi:hypothetical protein
VLKLHVEDRRVVLTTVERKEGDAMCCLSGSGNTAKGDSGAALSGTDGQTAHNARDAAWLQRRPTRGGPSHEVTAAGAVNRCQCSAASVSICPARSESPAGIWASVLKVRFRRQLFRDGVEWKSGEFGAPKTCRFWASKRERARRGNVWRPQRGWSRSLSSPCRAKFLRARGTAKPCKVT